MTRLLWYVELNPSPDLKWGRCDEHVEGWRYQAWIVIRPINFSVFRRDYTWWKLANCLLRAVLASRNTLNYSVQRAWPKRRKFQPEFRMMMTSPSMTDRCILPPPTAPRISSACWWELIPGPRRCGPSAFPFFHSLASSPQSQWIYTEKWMGAWFTRKCWVDGHWCLLDCGYMGRSLSDDIDLASPTDIVQVEILTTFS
jgi:hypothetical protein